MKDRATFLQSKPISEIVISHVDQVYVTRIKSYLESLGCRVTYQGERGRYHIQFPEGTTDNTYAGQSTQWTHRTTIRLLGGQRLTKYVVVSLPKTDNSITMLAFPNDILLKA